MYVGGRKLKEWTVIAALHIKIPILFYSISSCMSLEDNVLLFYGIEGG